MKTIKKEIEKYENFINIKNKETALIYVYNKNLEDFKQNANDVKYIVVGDNPGIKEAELEKYFVGKSGVVLRNFFKNELNIQYFDKEIIVLNKTPIHTKSTNDLKVIDKKILEESVDFSASIIVAVAKKLDIPILLFGKSGFLFKPFLDKIKDKNVEIRLYNHPSYGNLSKQWKEFLKINPNEEKIVLFEKLGKKNFQQKIL